MRVLTETKVFNGGMDMDTDIRMIPNGKYLKARNIKLNNKYSGRVGVVSNLPGIKGLSRSPYLVNGDEIIGVFPDVREENLYIFVYNALSLHKILKYSILSDSFEYVLVSSSLNFSVDHPILSFDVVDNDIYWTDFYNIPRHFEVGFDYFGSIGYTAYNSGTTYASGATSVYNGILYISNAAGNLNHTPSGTYTNTTYWLVSPTQGITDSHLSIAVPAPLVKPSISISTDTTFLSNFVYGKFFQFKYRFVYKNGQKSVFSPISNVAYSSNEALSYLDKKDESGNTNNVINITISPVTTNGLVDKIEIAAREGNNNDFYIIDEVNYSNVIGGVLTKSFYNNGVYIPIPINESIQIYDDIPLKTRALRYSENRLLFGGAITGYDKITPNYTATRLLRNRPGTSIMLPAATRTTISDSTGVTLAAQASTAGYGTLVAGDVIEVYGQGSGGFGYLGLTVLAGWNWSDVVYELNNYIYSAVDSCTDPGNPINYSIGFLNSYSGYLNCEPIEDPLYGTSFTLYNDNFYYRFYSGASEQPTFKSGSYYNVALEYYDDFGRTNGAIFNNEATVYIPTIAERGLTPSSMTNAGGASILITINHTPPSWASYYSVVWSNAYRESLCLTTSVYDAKPSVIDSARVRISLQSLLNSVNVSGMNLSYSFEKGDRVRFITYDASGGSSAGLTEWANKPYDAEIIQYFDNYADSPADGIPSIEFYRPNGLALNQIKYAQIEIYRPSYSKDADQSLFNEGVLFPITNGIHQGDIDQSSSGTVYGSYVGVYVSGSIKYLRIPASELNAVIKAGDQVTFVYPYTTTHTVSSVTYRADKNVDIVFTTAPWTITDGAAYGDFSYSSVNKPAIVYLENGDAYLRQRSLSFSTYSSVYVESYALSDFIDDSEHYSLGRQTAIIEQSQSDNYSTIFYTEPIVPNTSINGLNRVYPDFNYVDYDRLFGSINYIHNDLGKIVIFQEDRVSFAMVNKSVIYDSQGNANFMGTVGSVLSDQVAYQGEYGMHNPLSFQSNEGNLYWIDVKRGYALRLSRSGIDKISRYGANGWFSYQCELVMKLPESDRNIYGLFDSKNSEYIVSFGFDDETIVFSESENTWSTFLDTPFTGGCSISNRVFYIDTYDLNEFNRTDVANNMISYYDGDTDFIESSIEFISNISPAELKTYLSIIIDGNYAWDTSVSVEPIFNFASQETMMLASDYTMYETEYSSPIFRDMSTPNVDYPLINGYPIKGKEAKFKLELPYDINNEVIIKTVRIVVSNG